MRKMQQAAYSILHYYVWNAQGTVLFVLFVLFLEKEVWFPRALEVLGKVAGIRSALGTMSQWELVRDSM